MSTLTTTQANSILDDLLVEGTTYYFAMHTASPGDDGDNEVDSTTDPNYARQAVTFDAASSKTKASNSDVSFTSSDSNTGYTVTYGAVWDALTSGNLLIFGKFTSSWTFTASTAETKELSAGDIVYSIS